MNTVVLRIVTPCGAFAVRVQPDRDGHLHANHAGDSAALSRCAFAGTMVHDPYHPDGLRSSVDQQHQCLRHPSASVPSKHVPSMWKYARTHVARSGSIHFASKKWLSKVRDPSFVNRCLCEQIAKCKHWILCTVLSSQNDSATNLDCDSGQVQCPSITESSSYCTSWGMH